MKKVCACYYLWRSSPLSGKHQTALRLQSAGTRRSGCGDGDTIKIRYGGVEESVRLLGVDTPETVHPDIPPEPYGAEAAELPSGFCRERRSSSALGVSSGTGTGACLHSSIEPPIISSSI